MSTETYLLLYFGIGLLCIRYFAYRVYEPDATYDRIGLASALGLGIIGGCFWPIWWLALGVIWLSDQDHNDLAKRIILHEPRRDRKARKRARAEQ